MKKRRVKRAGLDARPPINFLVRHMEEYFQASGDLRHHARPMVGYLGRDIDVYTRIVDISEIDKLMIELNAHIDATGFSTPNGLRPQLEHRQSRGRKFGLERLEPDCFEKLLEYYKEDYAILPTVSVERTRAQYEAARA